MKKVKIGDFVKVSNGEEAFWVQIQKKFKSLHGYIYKTKIDSFVTHPHYKHKSIIFINDYDI